MKKGNLKACITGWCNLLMEEYKADFKLIEVQHWYGRINRKTKRELIEELNLEEVTPEEINPDEPLFGDGGLGLDSIDALEIILILERNYGIKIKNPAEGNRFSTQYVH